jgi:hypothetical protein
MKWSMALSFHKEVEPGQGMSADGQITLPANFSHSPINIAG